MRFLELRALSVLAVATAAALALVACGAAAPALRVTSPFTAEHAAVFDDGADFVARPDALDGDWREDWDRDMQKRVGFSDLICVVTVNTLRTDTDLDRNTTYRLIAHVDRMLYGESPGEEESLVVREGSDGYASIDGNDRRILNKSFVLFLKWYQPPTGPIAAHWHLSPASQQILQATSRMIERRNVAQNPEQREIIVEHAN